MPPPNTDHILRNKTLSSIKSNLYSYFDQVFGSYNNERLVLGEKVLFGKIVDCAFLKIDKIKTSVLIGGSADCAFLKNEQKNISENVKKERFLKVL